MIDPDEAGNDAAQVDSTQRDVGDVEAAGETTAAATTTSTIDTKPVGADTMAKVGGTSNHIDQSE